MPSIFIVLPAYNEESALRQLIPDIARRIQLLKLPFKICLVDDGSKDGTETLAREMGRTIPLQYLRHSNNQGYGAALRTGFQWVIKNAQPQDVAICMDADNTHSPVYIPALVKKLDAGYEVITASYSGSEGRAVGVPFKRRLLSLVCNALLRMRFRLPGIHTYTNGYRAYRVTALQHAHQKYGDTWSKENNFAGGTEIFLEVCRAGGRPGEVPFELHYEKRGTQSKINIPRTVMSYFRLLSH